MVFEGTPIYPMPTPLAGLLIDIGIQVNHKCWRCVAGVNSTGHDEIQFTLKDTGGQRRRRRHLEVTMATVNVPLGPRQTSHSRRSLGNSCHGNV